MPRDGFEDGSAARQRAWEVARFHAGLFRRIPSLLFTSTDAVLTGVAVAFTLVTLANPELVKRISVTWEGFSRWWALVPIIFLMVWRLMRANFDAYDTARSELASLKGKRSEEWAQADKLMADFIISTRLSGMGPTNPADKLTLAKDDLAKKLAAFHAAPSPSGLTDLRGAATAVINLSERVSTKPARQNVALFESTMAKLEEAQAKFRGIPYRPTASPLPGWLSRSSTGDRGSTES